MSMEFSRQEHWSGWPFPSPGDLLDTGTKPGSPTLGQILYHLSHQGDVTVCDKVGLGMVSTSSLLSCDESIFPDQSNSWGRATMTSFFWKICSLAANGSSESRPLHILFCK